MEPDRWFAHPVFETFKMQESDFHEVADEFINLANDLSDEWAMPFLSAAFMYAAARYNSFFFFETDGEKEKEGVAIDYYCEQYRKMLQECMHELRNEKIPVYE